MACRSPLIPCACSAQRRFHRAQQREAPADTLLQCCRALFRVRDELNGVLRLPPFLRGWRMNILGRWPAGLQRGLRISRGA